MWIFDNAAQALMAGGIFLAVLDALAFGFATLFLTLIGLAMVTTGILIYFGVVTDSSTIIMISIAVLSAIYGALLWKPLKELQEQKSSAKVKSDLTDMVITLDEDVAPEKPGKHHYSGVDWKVEASEPISAGTQVEVYDIQVGVMKVRVKS